LTAQGE